MCRPGGLVAARDGGSAGSFGSPGSRSWSEWLALYRAVARRWAGSRTRDGACWPGPARPGSWPSRPRPAPGATAGAADRAWWGTSWAERLTKSPFGDRAVEHGLATRDDLERLAGAWLRWADSEDAWFLIPHGEILAQA